MRPAAVAGLALLLALASLREPPPADQAAAAGGRPAAGVERQPAGEAGFESDGSGRSGSDVEVGLVDVDPDAADGAAFLPRSTAAGEQGYLAEMGNDGHEAPPDEGATRALALRLAGRLAGQMTAQMAGQMTGVFVVDPFGVRRAERPQPPAALDTVLLDQLEL